MLAKFSSNQDHYHLLPRPYEWENTAYLVNVTLARVFRALSIFYMLGLKIKSGSSSVFLEVGP